MIIGIIPLLVADVREAWNKITGGTGQVRDAIARVGAGFRAIWDDIKAVGERIWKFFAEDIPNAIRQAWQAALQFIYEKADALLESLRPVLAFAAGGGAAAAIDITRERVHQAMAPETPGLPGAGGSSTTSVSLGDTHIDVHPSTGMDEKAIGE